MAASFLSGDLFADPSVRAFAHGCNCAGAMGAGIAVAFRDRWPAMYDEYRARCRAGTYRPGDLFVWAEEDTVVYNLATQETWRTKATLEAIEQSVSRLLADAQDRALDSVAMPRIGAGLGGLEWNAVREILVRLATPSPVELRICDEYVAGQPLR